MRALQLAPALFQPRGEAQRREAVVTVVVLDLGPKRVGVGHQDVLSEIMPAASPGEPGVGDFAVGRRPSETAGGPAKNGVEVPVLRGRRRGVERPRGGEDGHPRPPAVAELDRPTPNRAPPSREAPAALGRLEGLFVELWPACGGGS